MVQPIFPTPRRVREAVREHAPRWLDALLLGALALVAYGTLRTAASWTGPSTSELALDLSPSKLPLYAALSTLRMAVAYGVSLVFAIAYARVAAASRAAERVLVPVLDILQSIPILSFLPGVVLALTALFPGRELGLELAAIVLIFTSQAWNLAFSFHQSLLTVPADLVEASKVYRLGFWYRFTRLELPFGAIPLIANSMMSWAGGWFFLMASEQFTLGQRSFRLPGLGSYLATAAERGDTRALVLGLVTLVLVVVLLDFVLWRPLVAWSDLFKLEQAGGAAVADSPVLAALRASPAARWFGRSVLVPLVHGLDRLLGRSARVSPAPAPEGRRGGGGASVRALRLAGAAVLVLLALAGAAGAAHALSGLSARDWLRVAEGAGATLLRTTIALVLGAAWTIPAGVAIGLSPTWSRRIQPLVQVVASIPATALFPALLLVLVAVPGGLNVAAVVLMVLATQWYVLFNVIAGAMAIPNDLKEAASMYRLRGGLRWRTLILPGIFPYVVTGMITAMGGAWNASVVSEFVSFGGQKRATIGLGSLIAQAADGGHFPLLFASTLVMAAIVITANRLVWRRLYRLAESRYQLG